MKQKLSASRVIYTSFMLFSIFFGAGNMIFPPQLGQQAGVQSPIALLGFIITDAGLAVLGIIAVVIAGNRMDSLVGKAGKKIGFFLTIAIYLLIGPLFALPRTGSVSFETGILPFLQEGSHTLPMFLYTAIFFGLTYFFSLKPSKIIDIAGKFMTPLLLLSIMVIFIAAIFNPLGEIVDTSTVYKNGPFIEGLLQGYLALDGFAALIFAIVIINALKDQGVTERREVMRYTILVGVIAVLLLCVAYGTLCYVGAQTSGMSLFANGEKLLNYAVYQLFGWWGNFVLGIAMVLACLTTSIGLTTSFGDYFAQTFPKWSYKAIITVVVLFSWLVSNVGLTTLINTVLPVLVVLYPLVTVLVILSYFDRFWRGRTEVYAFSMAFALCFSIFDGFKEAHISLWGVTEFMMQLPLASLGIGWLIPAVVGFLIGLSPIGRKVGLWVRSRSQAKPKAVKNKPIHIFENGRKCNADF